MRDFNSQLHNDIFRAIFAWCVENKVYPHLEECYRSPCLAFSFELDKDDGDVSSLIFMQANAGKLKVERDGNVRNSRIIETPEQAIEDLEWLVGRNDGHHCAALR